MEKESGHGSVGMADLPVLVITMRTCAAGVKQSSTAQLTALRRGVPLIMVDVGMAKLPVSTL